MMQDLICINMLRKTELMNECVCPSLVSENNGHLGQETLRLFDHEKLLFYLMLLLSWNFYGELVARF